MPCYVIEIEQISKNIAYFSRFASLFENSKTIVDLSSDIILAQL
jgi:hypothetical protein